MIQAAAIALMLAAPQAEPSAWFGTWVLRAADAGDRPETLIYSNAGNGAMRMVSIEAGSIIVTRFDGRPEIDQGVKGTREPALAVKVLSPTSYSWTYYRAGRPYVAGVNTLAADRRSFTEVSWPVAEPARKVTLIYERR